MLVSEPSAFVWEAALSLVESVMWMDDLWGEMVSLVGNKNERFEPVIVTHLCREITLP